MSTEVTGSHRIMVEGGVLQIPLTSKRGDCDWQSQRDLCHHGWDVTAGWEITVFTLPLYLHSHHHHQHQTLQSSPQPNSTTRAQETEKPVKLFTLQVWRLDFIPGTHANMERENSTHKVVL